MATITTNLYSILSAINDEKCAIILPDIIKLRNFEDFANKNGYKSVNETNIYTIDSFARAVTGAYKMQELPRFIERLLAHDWLKAQNSGVYHDLSDYPDFITFFLEDFYELRNNIDLEQVNFRELQIFKEFNRIHLALLNSYNYTTPRDIVKRAIQYVHKITYTKIYFVDFFIIDNILLNFIETLAKRAHVILVYAPTSAIDVVQARLQHLNPKLNVSNVPDKHINIIGAPDERRELIVIAKTILEKIDTEHLSFEDFIVAFRDAKRYAPVVKEVFAKYGIKYFIEIRYKYSELEIYIYYKKLLEKISAEQQLHEIEYYLRFLEKELLNIVKNMQEEYRDTIKFITYLTDFRKYYPYINARYGTKISGHLFKTLIDEYVGTGTYGKWAVDKNVVRVIDVGNMLFNKVRYVFVGGMKEGIFPRNLSDRIVAEHIKKQINHLYYRSKVIDEKNERYYFDTIVSSGEVIFFTYPYMDIKARREFESKYLRELQAAGLAKKQVFEPSEFYPMSEKYYIPDALLYNALLHRGQAKIQISDEKSLAMFKEITEQKRVRAFSTSDKEQMRKYLQNKIFTPTEITTFRKCKYYYLYQYVLGIKIPRKMFDSMHMGEIYHKILKDYYATHPNFKQVPDGIMYKTIDLIVSQLIKKYQNELDLQSLTLIEQEIKRRILKFLEYDRDLNDIRIAQHLEEQCILHIPYSKTLRAKIVGRIDRIDKRLYDQSYWVIDYKYTGIGNLKKYIKEDLSLPLYMLYWKNKAHTSVSGIYYAIMIKNISTHRFKRIQYQTYDENRIGEALDNVKAIIAKILNLDFLNFDTTTIYNCQECKFKHICSYVALVGSDTQK